MLSERIKNYRKEAGLTQQQLGERIGLSGVAIMQYEKGQRTPSKNIIEKLCKIFGCTVDDLTKETYGSRIKAIRKEKGLTQKKLAELSGIAEITIRQYEAEKYRPKVEAVKKLAVALEVSPFDITVGLMTSTEDLLSMLSTEELIAELEKRIAACHLSKEGGD